MEKVSMPTIAVVIKEKILLYIKHGQTFRIDR